MLRSTVGETMLVHQRLNERRAMMLCCKAKTVRSARLTSTASATLAAAPLSMVLGTQRLPAKAIA